jgi:hypothetical protein
MGGYGRSALPGFRVDHNYATFRVKRGAGRNEDIFAGRMGEGEITATTQPGCIDAADYAIVVAGIEHVDCRVVVVLHHNKWATLSICKALDVMGVTLGRENLVQFECLRIDDQQKDRP